MCSAYAVKPGTPPVWLAIVRPAKPLIAQPKPKSDSWPLDSLFGSC
jgi:hypothetical protein